MKLNWRALSALTWSLARRRRRRAKNASANPIGLVRPWDGELDGEEWLTRSSAASQPQHCLLIGIGGFMVRQRKSHTRVKKGPAAQAEVLSGDGQPDEGETGEGSSGAWEKVGITRPTGNSQGGPEGGCIQRAERVVGPVGAGRRSGRKHPQAKL